MANSDFEIGKTYTYDHDSDSEFLGYVDKFPGMMTGIICLYHGYLKDVYWNI